MLARKVIRKGRCKRHVEEESTKRREERKTSIRGEKWRRKMVTWD